MIYKGDVHEIMNDDMVTSSHVETVTYLDGADLTLACLVKLLYVVFQLEPLYARAGPPPSSRLGALLSYLHAKLTCIVVRR